MAIVEVKVPQLSESVAEATMLQWKKKAGEAVAVDEILIEIETDKVVLEVPAPAAGVLAEIVVGDPGDKFYDAKVKVLSELIKHHVKEEEKQRDSMFAQAKKADVDLDALGEQMMMRKTELMQMADEGTLPPPQMEAVGF